MRGASEIRLVWRLMAYAVRHKPSIIPITLLGVLSSAAEVTAMISIIPLSILAAGATLPAHSIWQRLPATFGVVPDVKFFAVLFLSLFLLRMITNIASLILSSHTMQTLFAHLATRAYSAFVRHLNFQDIVKQQIGHFFAIAGDESNRGAQIVMGVMRLIPVVCLFAAYTAIIFYQSWRGGIGLFLLLFLMVFALKGAFRKSLHLGQIQAEQSRTTNTHFYDSLGGLRTVRGFTAEGFVIRRYEKMMRDYVWTSFATDALSQITQLPIITIVAALLIGIAVAVDNPTLAQNMPVFFAGVMMFTRLMPMASAGLEAAMRLTANLKAGRNVEEMLQAVLDSEKQDPLPPFPEKERITRIEFDHVTFRYAADTPLILDDFSHVLQAGRSYAITGPSGSGKSSLVDLLLKFYGPDAGTIRVNGREIAQLSTDSLRRHVILAEQAVRISYGTVLENVQFDNAAARESAENALRLVGLTDMLQSLPAGLDTMLTFQGSNFSGGQRQRIGVARALVRTADVLILDESTNALDVETRKSILDALLASYKDRILIFVTHDPYVMEQVDEVIELKPSGRPKDDTSMAAQ
jgi:ABC-type multidrug transport system fused ATPase/permease subunit